MKADLNMISVFLFQNFTFNVYVEHMCSLNLFFFSFNRFDFLRFSQLEVMTLFESVEMTLNKRECKVEEGEGRWGRF